LKNRLTDLSTEDSTWNQTTVTLVPAHNHTILEKVRFLNASQSTTRENESEYSAESAAEDIDRDTKKRKS
jgi:hypothetical protein